MKNSDAVKILLSASKIPTGATVTKRTGQKQYMIVDTLKVYGLDGGNREIKGDDNTRFLVAGTNMNAISGDTELMWHTTVGDFFFHCQSQRSHK